MGFLSNKRAKRQRQLDLQVMVAEHQRTQAAIELRRRIWETEGNLVGHGDLFLIDHDANHLVYGYGAVTPQEFLYTSVDDREVTRVPVEPEVIDWVNAVTDFWDDYPGGDNCFVIANTVWVKFPPDSELPSVLREVHRWTPAQRLEAGD